MPNYNEVLINFFKKNTFSKNEITKQIIDYKEYTTQLHALRIAFKRQVNDCLKIIYVKCSIFNIPKQKQKKLFYKKLEQYYINSKNQYDKFENNYRGKITNFFIYTSALKDAKENKNIVVDSKLEQKLQDAYMESRVEETKCLDYYNSVKKIVRKIDKNIDEKDGTTIKINVVLRAPRTL